MKHKELLGVRVGGKGASDVGKVCSEAQAPGPGQPQGAGSVAGTRPRQP